MGCPGTAKGIPYPLGRNRWHGHNYLQWYKTYPLWVFLSNKIATLWIMIGLWSVSMVHVITMSWRRHVCPFLLVVSWHLCKPGVIFRTNYIFWNWYRRRASDIYALASRRTVKLLILSKNIAKYSLVTFRSMNLRIYPTMAAFKLTPAVYNCGCSERNAILLYRLWRPFAGTNIFLQK